MNKYKILASLGDGAYGSVRKAIRIDTGEEVQTVMTGPNITPQ